MRRTTMTAIILFVLLALLAGCSPGKESAGTTTAPPVGNVGSIDAAKAKDAGTVSVGAEGTTAVLDVPDSPLDGLEITVPAGAYEGNTKLEVSYAPVEKHTFGEAFNPISPLITIDNGDVLAEEPIELTIPVEIAEGEFAMGFYYDAERGTLEGLPLVSRDAGSVTVATRHFSSVIISAVNTALLYADIDSGFRPGVDDWQFTNYGSYIAPGGHCSGQAMTAMWYYVTKPDGPKETLFNRYDNNGWEPASPTFWLDDSLGYRFASVVQKEQNFDDLIPKLTGALSILHQETWYLFAYSILVTGEPQLVAIYNTAVGGGHAMVVYRVNAGTLYVADPNYPGKTDRVIKFVNGLFTPYNSGANAEDIEQGKGKQYDKIVYAAKTAWTDWDHIAEWWTELKTLTIGNNLFPEYQMQYVGNDGQWYALKDRIKTGKEMLRLAWYSPGSAQLAYEVYRDGKKLEFIPVINGPGAAVRLQEGTNRLGISLWGKAPDGRYKYIDFKYFNVSYTPETETPTTTTATTSTAPAKVWKLVETILPNLPEMPVSFKDSLGSHEMTLTVEANEIICEVRTPVSGGSDKGLSTLVLKITPPPGAVMLGEQGAVLAEWVFTSFGEPSFTSSFVELRRGEFSGTSKPIRLNENPTGSLTFKFSPGGDEFEVTARLAVYGDQARIRWVYRLE